MEYRTINKLAKNLISGLNIILFTIVWVDYYNDFAFDTYKMSGAICSVGLYTILYTYLCKLYKAYRVEASTILEGILSQMISLGLADIILYIECCLIFNQPVNLIPGLCTYLAQVAFSAVFVLIFKRVFIKFNVPQRTILIFGESINESEVDDYIRKIYAKHNHLFQIICAEAECEELSTKIESKEKYDTIMLYEVSENCKNLVLQHCIESKQNVFFTPSIHNIMVSHCEERHYIDSPLYKYDFLYTKKSTLFVKRIMDIVGSCLFIVLTSPIMLLIALAIKIEDGGKVIYKQKRCTLNCREFYVYKFRSMVEDAEKDGFIPCVTNDSRITRVGKVIRKIRMDELPQFFNVLVGQMSLVGPRPERIEHVEKYTKDLPEFALRTRVKGGLTGYAQIYGKYNTSASDKLKLDLMYIENLSVIEDLKILLLTIKIVFVPESTEGFEACKSKEIASTAEKKL